MVNAEQRKRMAQFVEDSIEDSRLYDIVRSNDSNIVVAQRHDLVEFPAFTNVLLHNYQRTMREFKDTIEYNTSEGMDTAHIFYKDGETFMVRLGSRGDIKEERSLKLHTIEEINAMIHLRDLEKAVLRISGGELAYFQPQTARRTEGVRVFEMGNVSLDYSHIKEGKPGYGFVHDITSKDYRQALEKAATTGPIGLEERSNNYARIVPVELINTASYPWRAPKL